MNYKNILYIHATNIHQGGGRRLLNALLMAIDQDRPCVLMVDERMQMPETLSGNIKVQLIKKSILSRLIAELSLYRCAKKDDFVLCFGNLPPLLPLSAFTSVFVQNRYLVDRTKTLYSLGAWLRLRISIERWWLRLGINHANQYLVQTPSMHRLMIQLTKSRIPVKVAPFTEIFADVPPRVPGNSKGDSKFVYVASGERHKNHHRLVEAWILLASEEIRPELLLTIDRIAFPELCDWIDSQIKIHNLLICNLGTMNEIALAEVYTRADALIFPSEFESFGLPLFEAAAAGLPILASELDFVRDIVVPEQTFNPASATSIAAAVKRFCGVEVRQIQILSPGDFLAICQL